MMPPWLVGRAKAGALLQTEAGTPVMVGMMAPSTVMGALVLRAHCPALGVKVKLTVPLKPVGSKVLFETPGPDQVPSMPDWLVGKMMGASSSQILLGTPVMTGVMACSTLMLPVAGLAQSPALGVKVNVTLPP